MIAADPRCAWASAAPGFGRLRGLSTLVCDEASLKLLRGKDPTSFHCVRCSLSPSLRPLGRGRDCDCGSESCCRPVRISRGRLLCSWFCNLGPPPRRTASAEAYSTTRSRPLRRWLRWLMRAAVACSILVKSTKANLDTSIRTIQAVDDKLEVLTLYKHRCLRRFPCGSSVSNYL